MMTGTMAKTNKNAKNKRLVQKYLFIFILLLGPIINWGLFWLFVNVQSIALAFQDPRTGAGTWENLKEVFELFTQHNGELLLALKNTALYFFSNLLIVIPLSMLIGFFIYKKIFGYKVFNIIFYLPCIISSVAMTQIYQEFLSYQGPINQLLGGMAIPPEGLLNRDISATPTILAYTIWTGFGSNILLFVGAMTRIPLEVFEAAKLEGCPPGKEILSIVVPLIWPTFSSMLILSFTGLFTASGPILLFSPGGDHNTTTLAFWIFKAVWGTGSYGGTGSYNLVSATGLVLTVVGMPIILTARWLVERVSNVEY